MPIARDSFLAALLGVSMGCSGSDTSTAVTDTSAEIGPAKAEAVPPADPVVLQGAPGVQPDGSIVSAVEWFDGTLEGALALATRENKLVFMDVGAYWCPPCHELDEKTFVDPRVGEALKAGFVALHVDAEKGEGPELADRYHIQAYPTLVVLEASGVERGRLVDFLPPAELLTALDVLAKGESVLGSLAKAAEAEPDDLELRYALAHAHALAAQREDALAAFELVLLGDPKNEMGLAAKVLDDKAQFLTEKLDKDYDKAISQYRQVQSRFPRSPEALRAHRKIARVLHLQGKDDEAMASVLQMVKADPGDVAMYANVGWFCFRNGVGPGPGLAAVNDGLGLDPENAELHYLAAELQAMLGHPAEALAAIRKASQAEPNSNYYQRQVRRFEAAAASASGAG